MITTKNGFNKFLVRKYPLEQEVFVDNGQEQYGGKGYVIALETWRDGRDMVCIKFPHGELWFSQSDHRIKVIPNQKYSWE